MCDCEETAGGGEEGEGMDDVEYLLPYVWVSYLMGEAGSGSNIISPITTAILVGRFCTFGCIQAR